MRESSRLCFELASSPCLPPRRATDDLLSPHHVPPPPPPPCPWLPPVIRYEVATEGDSFKCAFHTPENAMCWSICLQMCPAPGPAVSRPAGDSPPPPPSPKPIRPPSYLLFHPPPPPSPPFRQLDLLCAPWTGVLEDGGHDAVKDRDDWANSQEPPLLGEHHRELLHDLVSRDELMELRAALARGNISAPLFDVSEATSTVFSRNWLETHGYDMTCLHSSAQSPLPVFRGLRVRVGIHSGCAEDVTVHENTKRVVYGGRVLKVAKAVSDAPCGGQIIMSGDALAAVESLQALKKTVAAKCAGWRHGSSLDDPTMPAAMSVMHLGSHVIMATESRPPAAGKGRGAWLCHRHG